MSQRRKCGELKLNDRIYSIYKGVNLIGRTKKAAVVLRDVAASQLHAIITMVDDSHLLSDLNSMNGTKINGEQIVPFETYKLKHTDHIEFTPMMQSIYKICADAGHQSQTLNEQSQIDSQLLNNETQVLSSDVKHGQESVINSQLLHDETNQPTTSEPDVAETQLLSNEVNPCEQSQVETQQLRDVTQVALNSQTYREGLDVSMSKEHVPQVDVIHAIEELDELLAERMSDISEADLTDIDEELQAMKSSTCNTGTSGIKRVELNDIEGIEVSKDEIGGLSQLNFIRSRSNSTDYGADILRNQASSPQRQEKSRFVISDSEEDLGEESFQATRRKGSGSFMDIPATQMDQSLNQTTGRSISMCDISSLSVISATQAATVKESIRILAEPSEQSTGVDQIKQINDTMDCDFDADTQELPPFPGITPKSCTTTTERENPVGNFDDCDFVAPTQILDDSIFVKATQPGVGKETEKIDDNDEDDCDFEAETQQLPEFVGKRRSEREEETESPDLKRSKVTDHSVDLEDLEYTAMETQRIEDIETRDTTKENTESDECSLTKVSDDCEDQEYTAMETQRIEDIETRDTIKENTESDDCEDKEYTTMETQRIEDVESKKTTKEVESQLEVAFPTQTLSSAVCSLTSDRPANPITTSFIVEASENTQKEAKPKVKSTSRFAMKKKPKPKPLSESSENEEAYEIPAVSPVKIIKLKEMQKTTMRTLGYDDAITTPESRVLRSRNTPGSRDLGGRKPKTIKKEIPKKEGITQRKTHARKCKVEAPGTKRELDETQEEHITSPKELKVVIKRFDDPNDPEEKFRARVAFSMVVHTKYKQPIRTLGGYIADNVNEDCDVLITTNTIQRTPKVLAAIGYGKPICSTDFLEKSLEAERFLDPFAHLLHDPHAEAKWGFSLKRSLARSKQKDLFQAYAFVAKVTSIQECETLRVAITSCGGLFGKRKPSMDTATSRKVYAIASDRKKVSLSLQGSYPVVTPEGIYISVLRQEIVFNDFLCE